jgi:hypothetical protein
MNYLNREYLQSYLNQKYPNQFTILDWSIDMNTMIPELNYINKKSGSELKVKVPSSTHLETFIENYFSELFIENRDKKIKNILD